MDELYGIPNVMEMEQSMPPVSTRPVVSPDLVYIDMHDERVQDVIARVQQAILGAYPDAEFASYIGTNPLGIYVEAYTAQGDFDGILRVITSKFGNLHIAAGVDVCVVPRRKVKAQAA